MSHFAWRDQPGPSVVSNKREIDELKRTISQMREEIAFLRELVMPSLQPSGFATSSPPLYSYQESESTKTQLILDTSTSLMWRLKGNALYELGMMEHSNVLAKNIFLKALDFYDKAMESAFSNTKNLRSASKNLGITYWRLAQRTSLHNSADKLRYYKSAVKNLALASSLKPNPTTEWRDRAGVAVFEILNEASQIVKDELKLTYRVAYLSELFRMIEDKKWCVEIMLQLAEEMFHEGVRCREIYDFQGAIYWLNELVWPLEEASRFASQIGSSVEIDVEVLKTDVQLELRVAEATQANFVAQNLLTQYLAQNDLPPMSVVFDTLDWLKTAALKARGYDMEQEAIGYHFMGYIYEFILHSKDKAREYYLKVLQLAESKNVKVNYSKVWYIDTLKWLTEINKVHSLEASSETLDTQTKPNPSQGECLINPESDVRKIEIENKDEYKLIKFLYDNFPPLCPENRRKFDVVEDMKRLKELVARGGWSPGADGKLSTKELKRLLMKVIYDYHPDKNRNYFSENGERWTILAGRITQMLNHYYAKRR